jgi:aspartyl/glutamyl-tRNA(Asn/Gln) amidotransferase C subunit
MTNLTKEELKHLQKLSNVNIDESWEEKFLSKLDSVIWMLDKLNSIDTSNITEINWLWNTLRVIEWTKNFQNKKEILENVKHDVINNSILIKSALSTD